MKATATELPEVLILEPQVFGDARGFFMESFSQRAFDEAVGRHVEFVQDKGTKAEYPATDKVGHRVHLAAQERGLFTRLRGDCFCIAPPVISPYPVLDQIVERLHDATVAVLGR